MNTRGHQGSSGKQHHSLHSSRMNRIEAVPEGEEAAIDRAQIGSDLACDRSSSVAAEKSLRLAERPAVPWRL